MLNTNIKNVICTEDTPIVTTAQGKLRGFIVDGVATFRGIRYAKAERFMPPEEPDGWEGVRDAHNYGLNCPNPGIHTNDYALGDHSTIPFDHFTLPLRCWPESEHCQYLNIWSPELCPAKKKPVMVWIHGGGFSCGSALDLEAYDGEALARFGDVVVVTVNHRLNMLGFLNLAEYGKKFRRSANVGMLDLVAALQWIQKNIAGFGGDPDNVTIMGQSGGGGKVVTLLQMPAADGLFHRAIAQSGILSPDRLRPTQESSLAAARELVEVAGGLEQLRTMPALELLRLHNTLTQEKTGRPFSLDWAPVPNEDFAGNPFDVGFRRESAHIPMIVGSNAVEFLTPPKGDKRRMPEAERTRLLQEAFGADAEAARTAFEKAWPQLDTCYAAFADSNFRPNVVEFCRLRTQQCSAPVYNYVFGYESPFWGGWMPQHSGEIAFMMHNVRNCETLTGETADRIQDEMAGAWAAFARSGSPNGEKLPEWKPFTEADRACMVYANELSQTRTGDFDRDLRGLISVHMRPFRP